MFDFLLTNCMVDGMISYEFEVPQGPVVGDSANEIVSCGIFVPEFARVIRTYAHWVA